MIETIVITNRNIHRRIGGKRGIHRQIGGKTHFNGQLTKMNQSLVCKKICKSEEDS